MLDKMQRLMRRRRKRLREGLPLLDTNADDDEDDEADEGGGAGEGGGEGNDEEENKNGGTGERGAGGSAAESPRTGTARAPALTRVWQRRLSAERRRVQTLQDEIRVAHLELHQVRHAYARLARSHRDGRRRTQVEVQQLSEQLLHAESRRRRMEETIQDMEDAALVMQVCVCERVKHSERVDGRPVRG